MTLPVLILLVKTMLSFLKTRPWRLSCGLLG